MFKKCLTMFVATAAFVTGIAIPAQADPAPKIYEHARAIPTKSGKNVRITLYTKNIRGLRVTVDNSRRMKAKRFGKGCGKLRCDKWKVYAKRLDDECYDLGISNISRPGEPGIVGVMTVCEPFGDGEV